MLENFLTPYITCLAERALPEGGFPCNEGGRHRPDSTAWIVLAFDACGVHEDLTATARSRISEDQLEDGRISLSPVYPEAFWPTSLAILAWHGVWTHQTSQMRAIDFLLESAGKHMGKSKDSPFGHDTAIRGWPWIAETHSWVEPTSMILLALELTGQGDHTRAHEARQMLLDRQLESGGWNYGNTTVFGQQLRPMPEVTGIALNALAGRVPLELVEKSISYLKTQMAQLRTPLSLGWSILGLGAWGERPGNIEHFILQCLDQQNDYLPYTTEEISLMLITMKARAGLLSIFSDHRHN